MGQVHGISKVLRSRNNAKGTCQVGADEDNLSSHLFQKMLRLAFFRDHYFMFGGGEM